VSDRSDRYWMARALILARPFVAAAWPNPAVGCCVVRDGSLLGEGAHRAAGEVHAERAALAGLGGGGARGATLYVTLEPCAHHGRTPPCTEAIVDAGVRRVLYAVGDANPRVAGGGAERLREAGLEVAGGLLAPAAWELNHRYFESSAGGAPHVTLKLALSADGRLARRRGRVEEAAARRLTSSAAWRRVQRLRAASRAVLVGRGTVEADRPRLDVRLFAPVLAPRAVVLDSAARLDPAVLPPGALVLAAPPAAVSAAGRDVVACDPASDDPGRGLSWPSILAALRERGLDCLLVEGGAHVASTLLAAAPPQRVHLFLAPRFLGAEGAAITEYAGPERGYATFRVRQVGADVEWILRRADLPAAPFAQP
jgi:diaminohydroxyphosphoribosylaminopyrimidine deaminase / 5-amino-6-(5-phosphoribosylamino)uracil reductase